MSAPKKPEIEALGEARWSRIERGLFDRVDAGEAAPRVVPVTARSDPRRAFALLVAAAAFASIGGVLGWQAWRAPGTVAPAASRLTTISTGSHVRVGEASLDVDPQSVVSVAGDDEHGIVVHLDRGRVDCEVPPRNGRPPFTIEAGDVVVRVVGTHFAVSRTDDDVDVRVDHGVVQVTRGGNRVDVHSGESWSEAARAAVSASSASTPSATIATPAPVTSASAVTPPSARDVYDSASRLEASNPDAAIAMYRSVAAKGGPWGMNALYAEGRLEAERGRKDEARRALEQYLARYPSGPNAEDSRQLLESLR